jgi:hypothetical protein
MLLNLPATATARDLENAPPLGTHSQVRQRIAAALPAIAFDDNGKGRVTGAGYTVDVDLGRGDPVHTAVVELKGDSTQALAALLEQTGWRAFAPRRGAFVDVADLK